MGIPYCIYRAGGKKNVKKLKKLLAIWFIVVYTSICCGMIAVKREVAAVKKLKAGFPWSECQVRKLTTSHCTKLSLQYSRNDVREEILAVK